jgi:hypothetical protein
VQFLFYLVLQLLALVGVTELFAQCMPKSLRLASEANRYRIDDTRSTRRGRQELRAFNRLRGDLLALFSVVFLSGNALYFFIDTQILPVKSVIRAAARFQTDTDKWKESVHEMSSDRSYNDQLTALKQGARPLKPAEQIRNGAPDAFLLVLLWLIGSIAVIRLGSLRAYKEFGNGVLARNRDHVNMDLGRIGGSNS